MFEQIKKNASKWLVVLFCFFLLGISISFIFSQFLSASFNSELKLLENKIVEYDISLYSENESSTREYLLQAISACYSNKVSQSNECIRDIIFYVSNRAGVRETLLAVGELAADDTIFSSCHELTHYVGQAAYAKYGSYSEAFQDGVHVCYGGFYHGVMEGYFMDDSSDLMPFSLEKVAQVVPNLCGEVQDHANEMLFYECLHGLGHGLMFLTEMELPTALDLCDTLTGDHKRAGCYQGVFMENATSTTNPDHVSEWVHTDDPMYPCSLFEGLRAEVCYQYQSTYFLRLVSTPPNNNWIGAGELCMQVPEKQVSGCFVILATGIPSYTNDFEEMHDICTQFPESYYGECVSGVITALGGWYSNQTEPMEQFCEGVQTQYQSVCASSVQDVLNTR